MPTVKEAVKYTSMELAVMEGGHSLDKPTPSLAAISKKTGVGYKTLLLQVQKGIRVELEHTSDFKVAKEIALDHIAEFPDYYDRLEKVEKPTQSKTAEDTVTEKRKKRKSKPRWAAWGPGPYGLYGWNTGYSGDGGGSVGENALNELNVAQTLEFIKTAHGDQLYGKLPYWTHPRAVALTGRKVFGKQFNSDAVKTAFLHDVVEDTNISLDELRKLDFSDQVIQAVGLLTKNKSLSYEQNIKNIINSGNPLAMMVKYADNYENYSGDKSSWTADRAEKSQKKYLASLNMLGDKLGVKHHIN
jgi:hypothetical protein